MSLNKYLPHVYVLPEDDANRQLANGFGLDLTLATRKIQVLEEAGGWEEVLRRFQAEHIAEMMRLPNRFMVLLIDFDGRQDRMERVRAAIPEPLAERVFVLGAQTEPEELRPSLGSYETIGLALARDCRDGTDATWRHPLLNHNAAELNRLRNQVRPFLFP